MTEKTGDYIFFNIHHRETMIDLQLYFIDMEIDVAGVFKAKLMGRGLINSEDIHSFDNHHLFFKTLLTFYISDLDQIMGEIIDDLQLKEITIVYDLWGDEDDD